MDLDKRGESEGVFENGEGADGEARWDRGENCDVRTSPLSLIFSSSL